MNHSQVMVNGKPLTFTQKISAAFQELKSKFTNPVQRKPPFDPVDEASEQSFPASDPPAWPSKHS